MRKPPTVEDFKAMIKAMRHRERFVFDIKHGGYLEVYYTLKMEATNTPENICLTILNGNGEKSTTNKLLHLWSDDYYAQVYSHLA